MLNINHLAGRLGIGHRFLLEQRFVGRYSDASLEKEDNLFYQPASIHAHAQLPLKGPTLDNKEFYTAFFNETMIGFGKNVNEENVFDQNRLGAVVGYRMSKWLRLEVGYLNQIMNFQGNHPAWRKQRAQRFSTQ